MFNEQRRHWFLILLLIVALGGARGLRAALRRGSDLVRPGDGTEHH